MKQLTIIFLSLLFVFISCGEKKEITGGSELYRKAPLFRLRDNRGGRFYLEDRRGKVTLLCFWYTSCVACKREMVFLQDIYGRYKKQGLYVAAPCSDPENKNALSETVKVFGLTYPVFLDRGGKVTKMYRTRGYPYTVIIDKNLQIVYARKGYDSIVKKEIERKIKRRLEGPPDNAVKE